MDKQRLLNIMQEHNRGYQNAASSKELEAAVLFSGREIRDAVNELRQEGEPICSGSKGYYYAENAQELNCSIRQLSSRIEHISHARSGLVKAAEKFTCSGQLSFDEGERI